MKTICECGHEDEYHHKVHAGKYRCTLCSCKWERSEKPVTQESQKPELVNHPQHYTPGPFEVYKVLHHWGITDPHLWNAIKYLARAGKKDQARELEDLEKAQWYLSLAIRLRRGEEP